MTADPFWKTIDDARRERLFALMRILDSEAERYFAKGREDSGRIAAGPALFEETLRGAVRMELVMALRAEPTLEAVTERAQVAVRLWVTKHNQRRPNDVGWKLWSESGQEQLQGLLARVRREVA